MTLLIRLLSVLVISTSLFVAGCSSGGSSAGLDKEDIDGDGISNGNDLDIDGDGIPNDQDPDIDGDGIPNDQDPDKDGDGKNDGADGGSPNGATAACVKMEVDPLPDVVETGTMTTVGWRLLSATGDKNCGVSTSGLIRVYAKTNAEQNQSPEVNPVGEIREVRILVPDPADCTATTEVTYDFTEIATLIGADPADGFTYQATHPVDQATCESELPDFKFLPGACSFGNGNIKAAVNDYTEGGGNGQYKDDSDYAGCGLIGTWDVSGVTDMYDLFYATPKPFNEDISGWDVSNVTTMDSMFFSSAFNQNISKWDVSNVRNMNMMFKGTAAFNNGGEPLNWDVSGVTNMYGLFSFARKFNQDISGWDVSNVTDMTLMFEGAEAFANQDISSWCVSKIGNKPVDFDRKNPGFAEERQPNWGQPCDGSGGDNASDTDNDGIPNDSDPDVDGDGIPNTSDNDIDGDGIWNKDDPDIDGDGKTNGIDPDADGDGTPDAEDDTPGGPQ